jgi:hypothetical protein
MDNIKTLPPYPTIVEALRFLVRALDTKNSNKKLDDACRKIDSNYKLIDEFLSELICDPISRYCNIKTGEFFISQLKVFFNEYMQLVKEVPLDGIERNISLIFLAEKYFCHAIAELLIKINIKYSSPTAVCLLSDEQSSIDALFIWAMNNYSWFPEFLSGCTKENKDKITNWRMSRELPSISSISSMNSWSNKSFGSESTWQTFKFLIFVSRAIDFIRSSKSGRKCITEARLSIWTMPKQLEIGKQAHQLQIDNNAKYHNYVGLFMQAFMLLKRNLKKTDKDKEVIQSILLKALEVKEIEDTNGCLDYWLYWLRARMAVYSGDLKKANEHYKKAFNESLYRAGKTQKVIIDEALVVAAVQSKNGDQAFLKKLKSMAILFNMELANQVSNKASIKYSATEMVVMVN